MIKVPRFSSFQPASATSSRIKQRNLSRDTRAEILLRKAIWHRGLRYRLHARDLPGKPDIVFRRARVVVFCDGDFWHGRQWRKRREKLARGANAPYWTVKIAANVARDRRNTKLLRAKGWTVLRFWETDLLRDVTAAVERIESEVKRKANNDQRRVAASRARR